MSSTTDLDGSTQEVAAPLDRAATGPVLQGHQHLDRYVVLSQVGSGGMGVVHRAYDPKLRREVALKMLRFDRREGTDAPRAETRILREARAMAQLSHPNVLPVYDVERVGELVYIAMEFVDGTTLGRWMRRRSYPWRDVLEVFIPAGRGLAAAHAAGIVHRDFKPANVLMGNRGRVLVTDFGLAQARGDDEPEVAWSSGKSSERETVTQSGEVVGTPAYMAPEQLRGDPVDARADQYAFCVALFEGLYGRRPFRQRNPSDLLRAKESSKPEPEPAAQVPTWLFRIVERGLAPEPGDRYPTMEALLEALSHDPALARRRWAWAGGGALLGATVLGLQLAATTDDPCTDAETLAEQQWGPQRRDQVRKALLATAQVYATDTADLVDVRLGDYARSWAEAHVQTCEATRVRGEQSAEAFDLRMACLGRHRIELEATIETLSARVSVTTLRGASGLVASLPSVQQCADVEHLRDRGGPTDPEQAAQVQQLGERLARARALVRAGRTDEAASIADELERRTTELDAVVLHGETMMLRGRLAQVARDDPDTEQWFERAYADGVEARHAPLAIDASVRLVDWLGSHEARTTEAELWAQQARAWLRDRGEDDPRHTQLLMAEGSVYQVAGRLDDAQQAYSRAVARLERQADSEGLADAHRTLGTAQMGLGDARAASEHFTEELALRRRLLGEQHPSVGRAHRSLGATLYVAGELPKALAHFERALAIIEASLGPEHPMLAGILGNLGSVRDDLGDSDEARELLERALAIMEAAEGTGVTEHVGMLGNLASALRHGGQPLAAAEHLRRAATLIEQAHGPTHPEHVALLTELGTVLLEAGRGAAAREVLEQAEGLRSSLPADASLVSADAAAALGRLLREQGEPAGAVPLLADAIVHYEGLGTPLDPRRGRTLLELGRARMTLGEARAARMALEDAIVLLAHRQQDSAVLAAARFELAQALIADGGDTTERAKSLAGDALAGLDEDDPLRGRIRSWLDAHP